VIRLTVHVYATRDEELTPDELDGLKEDLDDILRTEYDCHGVIVATLEEPIDG
jgi:hypothetical protein